MSKKQVPIEKILLAVVATAGLIALVAVAPAAGSMLRVFGVGKRKPAKYYQNAVSRLRQKGYITFEEVKGKKFLRITEKGKRRLAEYNKGERKIEKPKRWDGKWRIVIFDIPEKKKIVRNNLRRELKNIGFTRLQNSVWIYPYDCEEFIKLVKADKRIGKDILYIVAERVEYDRNYKEFFNL